MIRAVMIVVSILVLAGCSPAAIDFAEQTAYEASLTKRCLAFDEVRSRAHSRLADIPSPALRRLHDINQAGRVICRESIDGLTSEVTVIVESLP